MSCHVHCEETERKEPVLRESFEAHEPGTLYVDLDLGSIRVESHDEERVEVEARADGHAVDRIAFSVERDGDDISVQGEVDEWWSGLAGLGRIRVLARVPRHFGLDAHTGAGAIRARELGGRVAADSAGGLIEIDAAKKAVLARTTGGAIRLQHVGGSVRAQTAGGLVTVRDAAGSVQVRALGGAVRVTGACGRVDARSGAGSISVRFSGAPAGRIETGAGEIDVRIPADAGAELDARTMIGGVRVDPGLPFSGERRGSSVRGRLGSGGDALVLRGTAGPIRVRSARGRRDSSG